jgi:tetratricopeptide (TPR) repeat protein
MHPLVGTELGNYVLRQFLAEGGMGAVFVGEHRFLATLVAVKVLHRTYSSNPGMAQRFFQEARSAIEIGHPGIVKILDFGQAADGSLYLVMELLDGQSLKDVIAEAHLGTSDTARLGAQIAAALAAAHDKGIVHRDLKPDNLFLVGSDIKILDFGIAKLLSGSQATRSNLLIGTPHYMAPEQARGAAYVGTHSDIYSLGVILFQMLTGELPFKFDNLQELVLKQQTEAPARPSSFAAVDPALESLVLECLAIDPAARPASMKIVHDRLSRLVDPTVAPRTARRRADLPARAVPDSLEEISGSHPKVTMVTSVEKMRSDTLGSLGGLAAEAIGRSRASARPRRALVAAVVAVAVVGAAGMVVHRMRARPPVAAVAPAPLAPAVKMRRAVAVLGFQNLSGHADAAWMSTALAEMITTELAAGGRLRAVAGDDVARARVELKIDDVDRLPMELLRRLHTNLGADLVVSGSYLALGAEPSRQIRVDLRVRDTATGEVVAFAGESGSEDKLFELVAHAGARLSEKLRGASELAAEAGARPAARPILPEAAHYYAEGLERLRHFDGKQARARFEQAVALEPNHPFLHLALSESFGELGEKAKARAEAQRAFELAGDLSRSDRLTIEGRLREASGDWDQAVTIYRALFSFFPDDLDVGLRLARAQTQGGKPRDALASLTLLRQLPPPAGDDPRIDLAESQACEQLSDFAGEQKSAALAARKGAAQGSTLLVANARVSEGTAQWNLAHPKEALAAFDEAQRTFAAAGDVGGRARTLQQEANLRAQRGDPAARALFDEALKLYRVIGDKRGEAGALSGSATLIGDAEPAQAIALYEKALVLDRAIGDKRRLATELNNIAVAELALRRLAAARDHYVEAAAAYHEAGYQSAQGSALANLAQVLLDLGDVDGARERAEDGLRAAHETGSQPDTAWAQYVLSQVLLARGDLEGARRRAEESLAIDEKLEQASDAAACRAQLARIALELGRPAAEVERLAREAADAAQKAHADGVEARALSVVVASLLAGNNPAGAAELAARARKLVTPTTEADDQLEVALAVAQAQAASGPDGQRRARAALGEELARATRDHYESHCLRLRLLRSTLDGAGDSAELARVARDARARGFDLVARKAERPRQ